MSELQSCWAHSKSTNLLQVSLTTFSTATAQFFSKVILKSCFVPLELATRWVCLPCPSDKTRNVMEIQVRLSMCVDRLGEVFPIPKSEISFPSLFSASPHPLLPFTTLLSVHCSVDLVSICTFHHSLS